MSKESARRGRPRLGRNEGKSAALNLRIAQKLKTDLDRAAKKNRKHLSREVEARLAQSFEDDRLSRKARPDHIRALGTIIMLVATSIEKRTGKPWLDDVGTTRHLQDAIEFLVRHFGATKGNTLPTEEMPDRIGRDEAAQIIAGIDMWRGTDLDEMVNLVNPRSDNAPASWSVADNLARHLERKLDPDVYQLPAGFRPSARRKK